MIKITESEAESLADLIESSIFDIIRDDTEIDNIEWLSDIMSAYRKCKAGEQE